MKDRDFLNNKTNERSWYLLEKMARAKRALENLNASCFHVQEHRLDSDWLVT
jgi:hypothetical protein